MYLSYINEQKKKIEVCLQKIRINLNKTYINPLPVKEISIVIQYICNYQNPNLDRAIPTKYMSFIFKYLAEKINTKTLQRYQPERLSILDNLKPDK